MQHLVRGLLVCWGQTGQGRVPCCGLLPLRRGLVSVDCSSTGKSSGVSDRYGRLAPPLGTCPKTWRSIRTLRLRMLFTTQVGSEGSHAISAEHRCLRSSLRLGLPTKPQFLSKSYLEVCGNV